MFERYEVIEEAAGMLLLRHVSGRFTVVGIDRDHGECVFSGMPEESLRGDDTYYGPISDDGVDSVSNLYSRSYARKVFTQRTASHDCWEHAVAVEWDGVLGHGWECGSCGKLLQVG